MLFLSLLLANPIFVRLQLSIILIFRMPVPEQAYSDTDEEKDEYEHDGDRNRGSLVGRTGKTIFPITEKDYIEKGQGNKTDNRYANAYICEQ